MNNTFGLLPILLMLILSAGSYAQTQKKQYLTYDPATYHANVTGSGGSATIKPEIKALRNFKKSYPGIVNETWNETNGYYFVTFSDGNVKNKVVYTRDGQLDYSLKIYNENKLPSPVRAQVKSIYYDYTITNVQELRVKGKTIYLVKLTDSKTWKLIRVHNGDLEEIENYSTDISPCR